MVEKNFFMDVVGHLKTFQNITLWPLPCNNYRVIAPIVQNACYRYSSLTVRDRDLKLLLMYSVYLGASSIYSYQQGPKSLSSSYCPWKFRTFNKNTNNFWINNHRYIGPLGIEASTLSDENDIKVKGQGRQAIKNCKLNRLTLF